MQPVPGYARGLMQNMEFKAELRDLELARSLCSMLGASFIAVLEQTDSYFACDDGRLKQRVCPGEPTEVIFYQRSDQVSASVSEYQIMTPDEARERFGAALDRVEWVVRKRRELFLLGSVRIHLDRVESLGDFFELEAVVSPSNGIAACRRAVEQLRVQFAPALGEPIAWGYVDLLAGAHDNAPTHGADLDGPDRPGS